MHQVAQKLPREPLLPRALVDPPMDLFCLETGEEDTLRDDLLLLNGGWFTELVVVRDVGFILLEGVEKARERCLDELFWRLSCERARPRKRRARRLERA